MTVLDTDFQIDALGNIRNDSTTTNNFPVIELHRWLIGKLGSPTSTGNDLLDVTNAIIPSVRKTDNIIILNAPYNISDTEARRFYNGSIQQDGGNTLYSGLKVAGVTRLGTTQLQIVQNGALLTNWWGTGVNVDAANTVLLQMLVKTRVAGADIDGKRIRVQARELGDTFASYPITLSDGFNTAAIFTKQDDFNQTAAATISGWTTITNTEGYQSLDVDGNGTNEQYISKWLLGSQTKANLYERAKWLTRRGSGSTIHGMNGELFIGITHSITYTSTAGAWTQNETLSWGSGATAGTGALLGVSGSGTTGTFYIQLLTGVICAASATITGATSGKTGTAGTITSQTVDGNCYLANYSGSISGNFGVGIDPTALGASDALRALDNISRNPPNNVQIAVTGVVVGDVIFAARTKAHSTTASGSHTLGAVTLNLAAGIPAAYDGIGRLTITIAGAAVEHVFTAHSGTAVTLAAPGLLSALSGGEAVIATQFLNDEYTTTASNTSGAGTFTVSTAVGSDHPTSGYIRVNATGNTWHKYAYTSFVPATGVFTLSGTLSQTYAIGTKMFIPFIDETAAASTITKALVYPGSAISARFRLYNAASNIVPLELPFTVGSSGASVSAIRNSDA
jgi:hypothetical protein